MNTHIKHVSSLCACIAALMVSTAAHAQVQRYISIDSVCGKAMRVYVSHADGVRNWHVHGIVLTQSDDHDLYVYAESLDGSRFWSGDYGFQHAGMVFNMVKAPASLVDGELRFKLRC